VRLLLYTGKGGVGKTTSAAATAALAAQRGARTLLASADAAHSLGDVLEHGLGPAPRAVAARLEAVEVDARAESERHWGAVRAYLVHLLRHQGIEEVVAEELALLPGAEELTTLLAIESFARGGSYDLVVVDCAPTGSALRMVALPEVARGAFRLLLRIQRSLAAVVAPLAQSISPVPLPGAAVFRDAERLFYRRLTGLRELLTGAECSVRLVATAERMTIDEAQRAHRDLSLFGLACDAVLLNRLLPPQAQAEPFFRDWLAMQARRRAEVERTFAPLPVLPAPLAQDEITGAAALARHGADIFGARAPQALLCDAPRARFQSTASGASAWLPLPHTAAEDLEVTKLGDRLLLRTPGQRRHILLPRHLAALDLRRARRRDAGLALEFTHPAGPN